MKMNRFISFNIGVLISFSGMLSSAVYAQRVSEPYRVDVELTGFPDSVKMVLTDFHVYGDTAMLIDDKASFSIDIAEDYPVHLRIAGPLPISPGYRNIWLMGQNGYHEKVTGDISQFNCNKVKFEGAPWSADMNSWSEAVSDKWAEENRMRDSLADAYGTPRERQLILKVRQVTRECDSMIVAYAMEHPNTYFGLWRAIGVMKRFPKEWMKTVYDGLNPEFRNCYYGEVLRRYLSNKQIEIGDSLADYDIEGDLDGIPFKLSDLKKDYIAVIFTQRGCGPCIMMKNEIANLDYSDKIAIVGCSIDEHREEYEMVKRGANGAFPVVWVGPGGRESEACLKYSVNTIPHLFIFGPDRKLALSTIGYRDGKAKRIFDEILSKRK